MYIYMYTMYMCVILFITRLFCIYNTAYAILNIYMCVFLSFSLSFFYATSQGYANSVTQTVLEHHAEVGNVP